MHELRLEMTGIVKEFPGVRALDRADFRLAAGEIHALLGVNGAGKSTLIKILSGVYQRDAGRIALHGQSVHIPSPQAAIEHGIATVYQDPQMVPSFTGYENIFLGAESGSRRVFSRIRRRRLRRRAEALRDRLGMTVDLARPVGELEAVEAETIAILRALARENTSVLVLDEPTSILTRRETEILFAQLRTLRQSGISIVYITHRLDEVFEIADRFTVFRNGRHAATCRTTHEGVDHARIAEMMLGRKLDSVFPPHPDTPGQSVLEVRGLGRKGEFDDVSFTARRGWILGVFGLVGSGINALCQSLFGVRRWTVGTVRLHGRQVRLGSAADAIAKGIFLVPGDRRREGQIADEPVAFNLVLSNLAKVTGVDGLIRRRRERRDAQALVDQLAIDTPDTGQRVSLLSGGNQQKVVIGKGLYADAEVYIFQEPTAGVDVGAKAGIYELIRRLSREKAVLVVGSDCEEVHGLCDHAMVIHRGRVVLDAPAREVRTGQMLLCGLTGRGTA